MPNWAYSTYVCEGDQRELNKLYSLLVTVYDNGREDNNGFGKNWLGNLVEALGEDSNRVSCRGSFYAIELDDHLSFMTETAWDRCEEVDEVLKKNYPSLEIFYIVDEEGMGIHYTNDIDGYHFKAVHVVETEEEGMEEFDTYEEAKEYVEEIIGKKLSDSDDLHTALVNWAPENYFVNYYKYEIIT